MNYPPSLPSNLRFSFASTLHGHPFPVDHNYNSVLAGHDRYEHNARFNHHFTGYNEHEPKQHHDYESERNNWNELWSYHDISTTLSERKAIRGEQGSPRYLRGTSFAVVQSSAGGIRRMVVLAVTWKATEGRESDVAKVFKTLQTESRTEPGCLMYIVHRHRTDRRRFFIYEQYEDDAALEAHRNSSHFQRYAVGELPKMAARVEGELYKPLEQI